MASTINHMKNGLTSLSLNAKANAITSYIRDVSTMSKSTAYQYSSRLDEFKAFIENENDNRISVDNLLLRVKKGNLDPYNVLNSYAAYLRNCNISALTLKQRIVTVKNFFEYCDIDISPRKFKLKVKLPKIVQKKKEALSKEDIVEILNVCDNIRLRTYVILLATTGMRAVEALSIRIKDIDFDANPAKLFVRGEYTKTKVDRIIFLTEEITQQLKSWLEYKHRTRRVCHQDTQTGKTITEFRTPDKKDTDLIFSVYQDKNTPNPDFLYDDLSKSFANTLDRSGKGDREDGNERRRQITFHSFRRFVKTTISDLGYADFSEWFIGHSGSTYWTKKDSEKAEIFRKIEPYLTFLNVHQLERQGADIQSKVEQLEQLNESMRDRDKMKDDAIAHLSDQLIALTTRLDSIERLQQ
ncbi:MAG: site-specific integrase [Thermoproteota archaeon]|nr:site-specific integrase [Thermoproteota archaeon]